ncbi:hypothetical protein AAC03nite_19140 [Alicyclobacillus acidoterrestris]|uniref:phosphotransferase n=1 Tax=Alicyclobacillus suci TaxID=2816080 RepID=UPI0011920E40|nr:phosphotransferase [Alicyclobacillus suci]GEO26129.1 hypothetical protein AAC03nite_19140 [Alicyclobacillus acidoterrestris]
MKRQKMPDWLEVLANEFLKPPYFLQAQFEAKEAAQSTHNDPETASTAHSTSATANRNAHSYDLREGLTAIAADVSAKSTSAKQTRTPVANRRSSRSAIPTQTYDIPQGVLDRYPVTIERREQMPGILRVVTDDGKRYAIKRTHLTLPHVWFVHRMLKYAQKQGFSRYSKFLLTKKKAPGVNEGGSVYYATEWIDAQPANFTSAEHVAQTAYALAQFHEATRGFTSEKFVPNDAFNLFEMTKERNHDLRQLIYKAEANDEKDEFDKLFVSLKAQLLDDAADSLQLLQQAECAAFLHADKANAGISHLDVIPGNCLYAPDHNVYLIDFELSTFAPRVLDMAHLLRRSLQLNHWSGDIAYACFLHFDTVKTIPKVEYRLVEALLKFPYRAWRLAHTRYHFFKDPAQLDDLLAYADAAPRRQSFLKSFSEQVRSLSVGDD